MSSLESYITKDTEELVKIFQAQSKPESDLAFTVLVLRFRKDLLEKCEIICGRYGHGPDVAEIIAENTFKAFAMKGNFTFGISKATSFDESLLLYLYKIARNELTNYYRYLEKARKGHLYDGTEKIITELPPVSIHLLKGEARIKYEVIQALPPHLRTVYLTYTTYERNGCNIPKQLQEALRMNLGNIKQSTVRTYKREAIEKINDGLKMYRLAKAESNGRN